METMEGFEREKGWVPGHCFLTINISAMLYKNGHIRKMKQKQQRGIQKSVTCIYKCHRETHYYI